MDFRYQINSQNFWLYGRLHLHLNVWNRFCQKEYTQQKVTGSVWINVTEVEHG